jgi:transcriptional regulator with GAF, ATPase, and Fis domain
MEQCHELILDVWREAGRHTEIATSTSKITQLLRRWLPVERLIVRRIEPERACIETVSVGPEGTLSQPLGDRHDCDSASLQELLAWCRRGEVVRWRRADKGARALVVAVPPGLDGECLVGPLVSEHGTYGVVLVQAASPQPFTPCHPRILQALLEPLTAVLDNDRRLRELAALREAAEAEKQSLLRRLGRAEAGEMIVGAAGRLRPVMERVDLVSRSDVPVLLFGETGSGKEVIARAIHTRSTRVNGPFIRVNCGAIPPDLIDTELFGHEKGSFTGAVNMRRGWFERADEGTLFLDEIGELPLAAQVRLLRVVQEGVFERVGGERLRHVDVRIVAATHRDLAAMVQDGRFREDLWYRLAVFPIVLPPLRGHPEDIAALADHFAQRAAVRFGLTLQRPTPQDIVLLTAYAWPGNIRELATVIDRAAILGAGRGLEVAKALGIIPNVRPALPTVHLSPVAPPPTAAAILPLEVTMQQHIEAALAATNGRIEGPHGAARLLRINPHTLRGRMRKLGIAWQTFRSAQG